MNVLDWEYYHNTLRTWLIALAILIGITVVLTVVRHLVGARLRHVAARPGRGTPNSDLVAAELLRRTSVVLFVALGIDVGSFGLALPPRVEGFVRAFVIVAVLAQVGRWGDGLVQLSLSRYVARHNATAGGDAGFATSRTTVAALGILMRAVLWIVLILVALDSLGVRVTALITGLGVSGIALALAVQNILGDLFAALAIIVDKPFVEGDAITVDTLSGTVERIGLKTTRVRASTGEQIVFSNADLLKSRIRNFQRLRERTSTLTITLDQSAAANAIALVPPVLRELVQAQSQVRFERSHVTTPTASGIGVETVYTVLTSDYMKFMDAQQAITVGLLARLPSLGVALASAGGVTVVNRLGEGPGRTAAPDSQQAGQRPPGSQ
jgi:small-conductance mechanosensitive channel